MRERAAAILLLVAVATFALLIERSITLYPGGSWLDARAPGHDVFRNFLCDLTQPIALNGAANASGARYARAAMIVLDLGVLTLFNAIPLLCAPSALVTPLRIGAAVSFAGVVAVPLTPSLELGAFHAVAVLTGAIPGIVAALLGNAMLARSSRRVLHALGIAVLLCAAVDAALYAHHAATGSAAGLALPVLQRAALILLLVWMVAVALTLLRQAADGPRGGRPARVTPNARRGGDR